MSLERSGSDQLPDTVARLAAADVSRKERRALLGGLATGLVVSAKAAGAGAVGTGRWLADLTVQTAPHIPVRDLATLQEHHGGIAGDELAAALVRNASRATAGIGAAGGAIAAIEWAAPPALLSSPVQLVAETLAVVAVEVKLIAELHEAYGLPVTGSAGDRATAYLSAWARRRGVDLSRAGTNLSGVLGQATRRELRDRLLRRMGRNLSTLGPLLTGSALGAELNRRATRGLGEAVRRDLLRQRADRR